MLRVFAIGAMDESRLSKTVVSLKPDLVLALVERDDVLNQIRDHGVPVLKLLPKDFETTTQEIATLGRVLGPPSPARPSPRPCVCAVKAVAGATNIFADVKGDFSKVSAEAVVARDPELIILADAYLPNNPQTPALVAARPGWDQIAAVRHGAVYAIQEELFARPSPRLADGLEAFAYLVHPDRFAASGGPHVAPRAGVAPYCAPGQTRPSSSALRYYPKPSVRTWATRRSVPTLSWLAATCTSRQQRVWRSTVAPTTPPHL
jgi:hypothetical protein